MGKNEIKDWELLKKIKGVNYTDETASEWANVVIVRDPLERFISGFLDKCRIHKVWLYESKTHCLRCKDDVSCFLRKLDRTLSDKSIRKLDMDTHHFIPQSWYCEMGKYMFNNYTIIKFSRAHTQSYLNELSDVFRRQHVPEETIQTIQNQITGGETNHSTFGMRDEKKILYEELKRPENALRFLRIYYHDYQIFGFPLPDFK